MDEIKKNQHGVPQYPCGHAGRLFVVLAAIDALDRPTAASVASLTGISKGNIDRLVLVDLPSHFGVLTSKKGPVYQVDNWGELLKKEGVKKCLQAPLNGTIIEVLDN